MSGWLNTARSAAAAAAGQVRNAAAAAAGKFRNPAPQEVASAPSIPTPPESPNQPTANISDDMMDKIISQRWQEIRINDGIDNGLWKDKTEIEDIVFDPKLRKVNRNVLWQALINQGIASLKVSGGYKRKSRKNSRKTHRRQRTRKSRRRH